jgi:AAA family ATP:ADP antiporter
MTLLNKLAPVFNIRSGEGRLVALLLVHSFFVGMAQILVSTTASTLFLVNFDSQSLSYVYIGAAVVAPLTGLLYSKLGKRPSFTRLLTANLGLLLLALVTFRFLLSLMPHARWLAMALYIWYYVQDVLINLEFWALSGRLLDVRQAKRLFGLIGAGEMVARSIIGFSIRPMVKVIGTPNLLFLAAGGIACSLVLMFYIACLYQPDQTTIQTQKERAQEKLSYADLIRDRYIILIAALSFLALLGYFYVDFAYLDQTQARYPDRDELAGFLGDLFAVIGLLALISRLFLTSPLISKYGLKAGLLALPVMVSIGVVSMAVSGTISGNTTVIFWLAVMTKLLFITFRKSTDRFASRILYQLLPKDLRVRAQTLIESMVEPVAIGVSGFTLLLLSFGAIQLSYVLLVILAIWIIVVILLSREYTMVLLQALNKRKLAELSFSVADASSMAILEKGLESTHAGEVIYYLDVLESSEHGSLEPFLKKLLRHPAPEVRQDVLGRIERLSMTSTLKRVSTRLRLETSPQVRGSVLRTLAALGETEVFEQVLPYLEDSEPQVKMGAMVGLLRSGGIEGVLAAGESLIELTKSPEPVDRRFAAQVLGEVGISSFYRTLLKLLQDDDPQVRRAALTSAGKLKNPKLWPLVIENLLTYQTRAAAVSALVAGGEAVVPYLEAAFAENGQSREALIRIAQICGRVRGDRAIALLQDNVDFPDADVRYQVLVSLSLCGYRPQDKDVPNVEQKIHEEVANAAWTLAALGDMGDDEPLSLLKAALNRKLERHRDQLFLLLSFIYDAQSVMIARDTLYLARGSGEKRAYALEMIDTLISQELKEILLPLLDDLSLAERLYRLSDPFPQQSLGQIQRLQEIIIRSDMGLTSWIKACTLWALARLDSTMYHSYLDELHRDSSPEAVHVLTLLEAKDGDKAMLSTVEKVIILKTVGIFSETPDEVLAEAASILEEVEVKAGETIFEKGDVDNCMYTIIEGQVRIHDGERTLVHLGERDVFGEMAVLDPQPRSASATATADTRLFRLDQGLFYELMSDRIEVARGIIRVLARRLRALQLDRDVWLEERPKKATDDVLEGIHQKLSWL